MVAVTTRDPFFTNPLTRILPESAMTILAIIHHVPDITISARHLVHLVERPAGPSCHLKRLGTRSLPSFFRPSIPQFLSSGWPGYQSSVWLRSVGFCNLFSLVPLLKTNFAVATVILFALIVMSISADLIALTEPHGGYFKFSALALATSLITLFTLIPMYAFVPCQVAP